MKKGLILILGVILIISFSCTKMKLNKLHGTWNNISLEDNDSTSITWTFNEDETLVITTTYLDSSAFSNKAGYYSFKKQGSDYFIDVLDMDEALDLGGDDIEGQYLVRELSKSTLRLLQQRTGNGTEAYIAREFVK